MSAKTQVGPVEAATDFAIRRLLVSLLEKYDKNKYDLSNNRIVQIVQMQQPRCVSGCTCAASRQWRAMAEPLLYYVQDQL